MCEFLMAKKKKLSISRSVAPPPPHNVSLFSFSFTLSFSSFYTAYITLIRNELLQKIIIDNHGKFCFQDKCGSVADKYIEYDPVIVLVDLVLLNQSAYRHLLYNSGFKSYWKLIVALLLGESWRIWCSFESKDSLPSLFQLHRIEKNMLEGERNFYVLLLHTIIALGTFVGAVIGITELRWIILGNRPAKYTALNLGNALTVGGCAKLLGLLGMVWGHISSDHHYALINAYTVLCLLTAYSGRDL